MLAALPTLFSLALPLTAPRPPPHPPPPTTEEAPAAAPATPEKAEATLTWGAASATMKGGVLTFSDPTEDVQTSAGAIKTADAFAPGHFDEATTGDAVLTGTDADGKPVKAVVRLVEPTFRDGAVTVRATPLAPGTPTILTGGEVAAARADAAASPLADLPADAAFVLKDAKVVVDSTAATEPAADGQKHGFVGSVIGASVGNRICGGSWVCAAAGAHIGFYGK